MSGLSSPPLAARLLPLALLLIYGLWASAWGLSADNDSELLLQAASHWQATGEYMRSRTSGFPLYEGLMALMLDLGLGVRAINLLSVLMAAVALLLAARIAGRAQPGRGLFAQALLLTWPLFLVSSAETMETMLALMFALALVERVLRQPRLDVWHGLLAILLVMSRLDAALLVVAVAATAWLRRQVAPSRALFWLAGCGLGSLCGYVALNGGLGFLDAGALGLDGLPRRLIRATVGMVNALQPVGWLGLALLGWQAWRRREPATDSQQHLLALAWIASLFYGLRFVTLPDEIFYLAIPGSLWLLVIASRLRAGVAMPALVLAGVLQCLLSVSLFVREPGPADVLRLAPALNPGPLLQERAQRLAFRQLRDPAQRSALSCRMYADCPALFLSHKAPILMDASHRRAIVSARYLYVFFSPRYPAQSRGGYREVTACDEEVVPSTSGWRVWQPAIPQYLTDVLAAGAAPHCRLMMLRRD